MPRTITEEQATQVLADWLVEREWTRSDSLSFQWEEQYKTQVAEEVIDKVIQVTEQIEPDPESLSRLRSAFDIVLMNHGAVVPPKALADLAAVALEWA